MTFCEIIFFIYIFCMFSLSLNTGPSHIVGYIYCTISGYIFHLVLVLEPLTIFFFVFHPCPFLLFPKFVSRITCNLAPFLGLSSLGVSYRCSASLLFQSPPINLSSISLSMSAKSVFSKCISCSYKCHYQLSRVLLSCMEHSP